MVKNALQAQLLKAGLVDNKKAKNSLNKRNMSKEQVTMMMLKLKLKLKEQNKKS